MSLTIFDLSNDLDYDFQVVNFSGNIRIVGSQASDYLARLDIQRTK